VTWEPVAQVKAQILPRTGHEEDVDNDILADVDTQIYLRYSPLTATLSAVDRIRHVGKYGERIYNIVGFPMDVKTAHDEVLVNARSGLNDG
jgi:head-tail adaptor